ncbi:MAG: DNA double-strand break repair nuclease NurA, partial [Candidatus Bathyarchaeota archaeon]
NDSPAVKELAERIKDKITIYRSSKRDAFKEVSGADAGSQVLPLASRKYAVISALVYTIPSGRRFFLAPESIQFPYTSQGERLGGILNLCREAKLYETAYSFIEASSGTKLLMLDGPLAFSNWWSLAGREEDRRRLIDAVSRLLGLCRDEGVIVAGVVKRPSARYLVYSLNLQRETDLPDSFLLLHTLEPGDRTDLFSPRTSVRKAVRASPFLDAIGHPIYSFYIRLSREWSIPPIRVDLPAFCLGRLDDIADYCYYSSVWKGIPLPIVRADEEVKISRRFIGGVYRDILSRVGRLSGEVSYLAPYWGEGGWMGA